jgi:phi13 family phage major tail protein
MAENKITFGLSQLHVAFMTSTEGPPVWGTPIPVPGAVSLGQTAEGSLDEFYADDILYYTSVSNNGYSLAAVVANWPAAVQEKMFGFTKDPSGMLVEYSDVLPQPFALMAETQGSTTPIRIIYYNCKSERPSTDYETKSATITPKTQAATFRAAPLLIKIDDEEKPLVRAQLLKADATDDAAWADFFKSVKLPEGAA